MAAAAIAKTTARVLWILNAHNGAFNDTVSDDRFIQEEIRRALIETESELVRDICEANHPKRAAFLAWSSDLAHGDTLPEHIGAVEAVQIKKHSGASGFEPAERTTRENIRLWRENYNSVFDTIAHNASGSNLSGYFNITNETIYFTGHAAQVKICTFTPDYSTPAHKISDEFEGALVAGAIPKLTKVGVPSELANMYLNQFTQMRQLIRGGASALPDVQEAQRGE